MAGGLVVLAGVMGLVITFHHEGLRTVELAPDDALASAVILLMAAAIVIGYHELLPGLSLDSPDAPADAEVEAAVAQL